MIEFIKTEEQLDEALARVYDLMQLELDRNSVEFEELGVLVTLVEEFEKEHYPFGNRNTMLK